MVIVTISEQPGESPWIDEYRDRRAYSHLTQDQLCARYAALLENAIAFDDSGGAFIARPSAPYWSKRLAWTEEEFRLRAAPELLVAIQKRELKRPRPSVIAARKLWSRIEQPSLGSYIVKFGKRAHVEEMLSKGRFRISPAASYSDPSLNPAIRDDELNAQIMFPAGTRLSVQIDGEYKEIPNIIGPLCHTRHCENFYVFCAAGSFDARLFDDFEADACLLVRDLNRFALALLREFAAVASMTNIVHGSVHYEDPLHPVEENHLVEMTKHFRYEYQREWRMGWNAEEPLSLTASPIFVEIGSLADSCSAYYL
jgi:hypothetical protein